MKPKLQRWLAWAIIPLPALLCLVLTLTLATFLLARAARASTPAFFVSANETSQGGDNYSDYVQQESPVLPPFWIKALGLLTFGLGLCLTIYGLQRGDYFLPPLVLGSFLFYFLAYALLIDGTCPPFLQGIYKFVPVCRYIP